MNYEDDCNTPDIDRSTGFKRWIPDIAPPPAPVGPKMSALQAYRIGFKAGREATSKKDVNNRPRLGSLALRDEWIRGFRAGFKI